MFFFAEIHCVSIILQSMLQRVGKSFNSFQVFQFVQTSKWPVFYDPDHLAAGFLQKFFPGGSRRQQTKQTGSAFGLKKVRSCAQLPELALPIILSLRKQSQSRSSHGHSAPHFLESLFSHEQFFDSEKLGDGQSVSLYHANAVFWQLPEPEDCILFACSPTAVGH